MIKELEGIPLTPGRGSCHPGRGPEWAGSTGRLGPLPQGERMK